jgi:uncharacterized protein with FMN-binding domain
MNKSVPVLLSGLSLAAQLAAPVEARAASSATWRGQGSAMRWGTIQVTITVKSRRVTAISVSYPTDRVRSAVINGRAVPILRSEALRAQSYNVHSVSGATLTSRSFDNSLYSAMHKAHLA